VNILAKDLVVIAIEVKGNWSIKLITNPAAVMNILHREENPDGPDFSPADAIHSIFPDIVQLDSEGSAMQAAHVKHIRKYLLWARTVDCAAGSGPQGADNNDVETGDGDDSENAERKRRKVVRAVFQGSVARVPKHRLGFESAYFMILNIQRLMCNVVKQGSDLSVGNWPEKLLGPRWYGQDAVDELRRTMPEILHGHIAEWFSADNVLDENFKFLKGVITDEKLAHLVRCFYVGKSQQRASDAEVRLLSSFYCCLTC
jgi:hypothetical protein